MAAVHEDVRKMQEVRNFVGRRGLIYVCNLATKNERDYFEGLLYNKGKPNSDLISSMIYPAILH